MFDILSTIELTASAAIVAFVAVALFGASLRQRTTIAVMFAAWFALVVIAGARDWLHFERGIGVRGLAPSIVLPVVILALYLMGTRERRLRLASLALPLLIGVHVLRLLGVSFLMLYADDKLPAQFALTAGWGDILAGLFAAPVAWLAAHDAARWKAVILTWNIFGLADLMTAVALGGSSSPGPLRVFFNEPSSAMMTSLPWIIIPCFLVPLLVTFHLVTFVRLRAVVNMRNTERAHTATAAVG